MWRSWAQKKWCKPPVQKTVNNRHHSSYICEFKGLRFNLSMIRRMILISKFHVLVKNELGLTSKAGLWVTQKKRKTWNWWSPRELMHSYNNSSQETQVTKFIRVFLIKREVIENRVEV